MSFDNLKVSTRLALGFGLAIVLGICIAALGTLQMQQMSAELDEVANSRMTKVAQFSEIKDNVNTIAISVRNIMIAPENAALLEAEQKKIGDMRLRNSELVAALDKTVAGQGREQLKLLQDKRQIYNQSIDRFIDFVKQGKVSDASAVLFGDVKIARETLYKVVGEANNYQQESGKTLASTSSQNASFYAGLFIGLAAAMALVVGLLGWAITRSLNRSLGAEPAQVNAALLRVAEGDLNTPIVLRSNDSTSMMATVKGMQESLTRTISNVRSNAEGVASASAQIAQGNNDLSARTEQQASALEETAASMEELNATVKQNADNARIANQFAQTASTVASQGGNTVAQVVETMKGINDASRKIADIISVIDGIAFQTNILALNAAVEAARAGEQGRGFAVVASEVRSLAGRSAQAAKEIKNLIGASVERVEQGTALVDQAGVTMTEVVSSIRRVTDIMGEISAASREQSAGVSQVGEAIIQMDQVTQQNAALVEEMAAAAGSLNTQADDLVATVGVFKLSAHAVPHGVRAAPAIAPAAALKSPLRSVPKPVAKPVRNLAHKPTALPKTPPKALPKVAADNGDDGWSSF